MALYLITRTRKNRTGVVDSTDKRSHANILFQHYAAKAIEGELQLIKIVKTEVLNKSVTKVAR